MMVEKLHEEKVFKSGENVNSKIAETVVGLSSFSRQFNH